MMNYKKYVILYFGKHSKCFLCVNCNIKCSVISLPTIALHNSKGTMWYVWLYFNTPVMFSEKEEAGKSSSLRLTHLASVVIELIQLNIQRCLIWMSIHTTFRLYQTIIFVCTCTATRITYINYKRKISQTEKKKTGVKLHTLKWTLSS